MKLGWKLSAVVGLLVTFSASNLVAQDPAEILGKEVGKWGASAKMWMPGVDTPLDMTGVETNRMVGDYWLLSDYEGDFQGQKFVGHGVFGYDQKTEKFTGTWVDSMTPTPTTMSGTWDAESNTMTWITKGVDPATGEMVEGKMIVEYKEDGTRAMESMGPGADGKMTKMMEILYKKK